MGERGGGRNSLLWGTRERGPPVAVRVGSVRRRLTGDDR